MKNETMGIPILPSPVLLITAVCYQHEIEVEQLLQTMAANYGAICRRSTPFAFTHTNYYRNEMGDALNKFFCAFEKLIEPTDIVDIKLFTNDLETQYSSAGKRRVNIDPGYLEAPKLILATTKNFSHRIYLGKGIYGDVQLYWRHSHFHCNEWTYPDYRQPQTLAFFTELRKHYLHKGEPLWPLPTGHQA